MKLETMKADSKEIFLDAGKMTVTIDTWANHEGASLFRDRKTGERYSLRDLPPGKGRYQDEPDIECGAMCEMAERELAAARRH